MSTHDSSTAINDQAAEAVIRTPERQHVGRSGLPGRAVKDPLRWRPASAVPGAELSIEAQERVRRMDESSRRARAHAMAEASTYVIGGR